MKDNPFMPDPKPELDLARSYVSQHLGNTIDGVLGYSGGACNGMAFFSALHRSPVPVETDKKVAVIHCVFVAKTDRRTGLGRSVIDLVKRKSTRYSGVLVLARSDDDEHFMHYSHFERAHFKTVEEKDGIRYMLFTFQNARIKVTPLEMKYKPRTDKHELTICNFDYCPYWIRMAKTLRKTASEYNDKMSTSLMEMSRQETEDYGLGMNYLLDGKPMFRGFNVPYDHRAEIEKVIS